jgi:hypothetical protein
MPRPTNNTQQKHTHNQCQAVRCKHGNKDNTPACHTSRPQSTSKASSSVTKHTTTHRQCLSPRLYGQQDKGSTVTAVLFKKHSSSSTRRNQGCQLPTLKAVIQAYIQVVGRSL